MSAPDAQTWSLAIDVGTTRAVAAACVDGAARVIGFPGRRDSMPTAMFLLANRTRPAEQAGDPGLFAVGAPALHRAASDPARFEREPRRTVGAAEVPLGDRIFAPRKLLAAVVGRVLGEAMGQHDGLAPSGVALTHPASWGPRRIGVLTAAARDALRYFGPEVGETAMWPLPEPLAAAWAVEASLTDRLAVLDIGGSSADAAVVERDRGGDLRLAGPARTLDVGGGDIDQMIVELALRQVDAAARARFLGPDDRAARAAALVLWDNARGAKEMLSAQTRAGVLVPALPPELGAPRTVQITRLQLEATAGPLLRRAAELLGRVIAESGGPGGAAPGAVRDVLLVGGASRLPALGALVAAATGASPRSAGDPGTAVALGAALWAGRRGAAARADRVAPAAGPPAAATLVRPADPAPAS